MPSVLAPNAEECLAPAGEQLRISMLRLVWFGRGDGNRLATIGGHDPKARRGQRRCKNNILVFSPAAAPQRRRFANGEWHAAVNGNLLQQSVRVEGKPAAIGREEGGDSAFSAGERACRELVQRAQIETRPPSICCRRIDQKLAVRG